MKKFYLIIFVLILSFSMLISAADEKLEQKEKVKKAQVEAITTATPFRQKGQLIITGMVICTSCDLKKQKNAKSQCSDFGCSYAIKVKKAVQVVYGEDGKPVTNEKKMPKSVYIPEYKEKIYNILSNDSSNDLFKEDYKGKEVIVVGKIYPDENVIEIDFVKVAAIKKK